MEDQLGTILKLRPVRFQWKKDNTLGSLSGIEDIGFIAQEVREVYPEMVITDTDGYHRIRYDVTLQVRMVKAIQELGEQHREIIEK